MKTAIIYASNHGCSEKCANILSEKLNSDTLLINLENEQNIAFKSFDTVIVGGSIQAGYMHKKVTKFINNNLSSLTKTKLGLFICCMYEGEKAIEQFENAFPIELRNHAITQGYFGGEFDLDKMNAFEKAIVKKVAKVEHSESRINYDNINSFAEKILN